MSAFAAKLALVVVALALLASYVSAQCAIANCATCALGDPNMCLLCNTGYGLSVSGACRLPTNGVAGMQSMLVAVVVVAAALVSHVL